jgi:hypothetical protein
LFSDALRERLYWRKGWLDRQEFLHKAIERLDREGWQNKSDTGWTEHDLEVSASRWAVLHVTTASEYAAQGTLVRVRLRPTWSLLAKVAFWSAFGFELLIVGFTARATNNWMWALLATMGLFLLFLRAEQRHVCRMAAAFFDELAKQLDLLHVPAAQPATQPKPPAPAKPAGDPFRKK